MFHEVYLPSFSSSHKNRGNWGELTFAEVPGIVTRDTPVSLLLIGRLSNKTAKATATATKASLKKCQLRCLKLYREIGRALGLISGGGISSNGRAPA